MARKFSKIGYLCQKVAVEQVVRLISALDGTIELLFDWNTSDCIYIVPCIIAISLTPNCSFYIRDLKSSQIELASAVLTLDRDKQFHLQTLKNEAPARENILYCVMTSGTSSRPKLVKVPSTCIWPNIQDFCQLFKLSEEIIFSAAPPCFDPFYLDVFVTFLSKVCFIDKLSINLSLN